MPTIFTHGAFAFGATKIAIQKADKRILAAASILAAVPDVDALFMRWIAYGDPFGHRGFTHSLLFALVAGAGVAWLFIKMRWNGRRGFWLLAAWFALVTASHGFFDALTDGGLGVAFFAPFDNRRYFFPFRPIPVAPLSAAGLFTASGLHLLLREFLLIWTFTLGALIWHRRSTGRKIIAALCWGVCLLMWVVAR